MRRVFHMINQAGINMKFTAVVEHCKKTGLCVGHMPDFTGVNFQGKLPDELIKNLQDVIALLLKDRK